MLIIDANLCDFEKSIDVFVSTWHDQGHIKHHILTSFTYFQTVIDARWTNFDDFKLIFGAPGDESQNQTPTWIIAHCDKSIWPREEKSTFPMPWGIGLSYEIKFWKNVVGAVSLFFAILQVIKNTSS